MKIFEKPQYAFEIKNNLCSFIAFINDIPAFNNMMGTAFNQCVPITHLVKNGENTFKVLVFPLKPATHLQALSDCFATIIVKDYWDNANTFIEISAMGFPAGTSNDTIKLPGFELKGTFEAKLPFDDFQWVNAPKLDTNRSTNIDLARRYLSEIHSAFKEKNTSFLFKEIITREQELSKSFYEEFEIGMDFTQKDFNGTFNDPNYIIQDLSFEKFLPKLYADGRIIAFENENYEQPIFFLNDVEFTRRQYPFYFCMNKENKMMVIR